MTSKNLRFGQNARNNSYISNINLHRSGLVLSGWPARSQFNSPLMTAPLKFHRKTFVLYIRKRAILQMWFLPKILIHWFSEKLSASISKSWPWLPLTGPHLLATQICTCRNLQLENTINQSAKVKMEFVQGEMNLTLFSQDRQPGPNSDSERPS